MFEAAEIQKLEAEHGDLVVFDDAGVILRALNAAGFDRHFNEKWDQPGVADWNVVLRQLVCPSVDVLKGKRDANGGLIKALAQGLRSFAGSPEEDDPRVDDLDASTPSGILEAAKLSVDKARELVEGANGARLVLVVLGDAAVVIRTPRADEFSLMQAALASGKDRATTLRRASLDHTVWSTEPVAQLFAALPGFPIGAVAPHVLRLGGVGTEARFRPRVRADRRAP